jgi:hypothetical protein
MPTMNEKPQATMTISQRENQYGTPEPQIEIRLAMGAHHRLVSATLHKLAANVEQATPVRENWIVQIERLHDGRGRVYLELADGTPTEAERGMAMLTRLARTSPADSASAR